MMTHYSAAHYLRLAVSACAAFVIATAAGAQERAAGGCCTVTAIDSEKGLVTAKERSGDRTFQFTVSDRSVLASLQIGGPVYANYRTNQVSLDGKKACCTIVGATVAATKPSSGAAPQPAAAAAVVKPTAPGAAPAQVDAPRAPEPDRPLNTVRLALPQFAQRPKLTAGTIQSIYTPPDLTKTNVREDLGSRLRQFQDPKLKQLDGIAGIRERVELPQVATDLLVLHARTLPAEELDSYIVSPKLAEEWLKDHPLPPEFVAKVHSRALDDGKKKKKGCSTKHVSTGCVKTEVEQSVDDLTRIWRDAWNDTADELGRLLNRVDDIRACFADETLTLSDIPVNFSVEPQIFLSIARDGKSKNKAGGASGNAKGTVAVGVPVNSDFKAQVKMFYIPCLPFAIRPRSIGAKGSMEAGGSFTATVNATGQFNQFFTIPPGGGVQIPVAVLPIALGGVPIAVLDISVYLDGTLDLIGEGTLDGSLKLQSMQRTTFDFECSGHGCESTPQRSALLPATAVESVKLDGRVKIKPAIYSALQLSLNYRLLSARAGPQPFLLGEIYGCAAAAGAQNTAGASSGEQSYALTADLDWGLELRAEASAGGKPVAKKMWPLMDTAHLYFKDLAQSTGLKPGVTGTLQPSLGQPTAYAATMPTCYPYPEQIKYRVEWTGGASATTGAVNPTATKGRALGLPANILTRTAAGNSSPSTCAAGPAPVICWSAPLTAASLNLAWPALGDYTLTVTPVEDKHGRKFDGSRATQLNIKVQQ